MSKHPYVRPNEISVDTHQLRVHLTQDGTRSVVELYEEGRTGPVGTGQAARRKGDPRNPRVGASLALARALQEYSDNILVAVEKHL